MSSWGVCLGLFDLLSHVLGQAVWFSMFACNSHFLCGILTNTPKSFLY